MGPGEPETRADQLLSGPAESPPTIQRVAIDYRRADPVPNSGDGPWPSPWRPAGRSSITRWPRGTR